MSISVAARPRSLGSAAILFFTLIFAVSGAAGAQSPAGEPDSSGEGAAAGTPPPTVGETVVVNEETGLSYRIEKIQKIEGSYRWVDEKTVRMPHGVHFEVVHQDDEFFWVKVWSASKRTPPPLGPTAEEEAAEMEDIVASYQVDIATVDRLALQGFENGLPRAGQWRQGFDVVDMNGDGHLDIVFGPARKSMRPKPNIFLGDSQGNWRLWREASYPSLPYDYGDAAAGDLNGDGHMDLALGVHLRGLLALLGDGKGNFSAWSEGIDIDHPGRGGTAEFYSSRAIELLDWNSDGRLDILAFGEGPKGRKTGPKGEIYGEIVNTAWGLAVFLNQGDGTWTAQLPSDDVALQSQFGDDFALADFNRDGLIDIALASRVRGSQRIVGIRTPEGPWESRDVDELRRRLFVGAVAAADHDGDGFTDLFVGYQSNDKDKVWRTGIDVYSPDKDLGWTRRPLFVSEGRRPVYALDTGDLDGDGHLDLVALTGNGETWVFLGDGEGFFVREESPELPAAQEGCHGYALRLIDIDRDGRDEVIAGFAGEPTGLPGVATFYKPGCQGEGSLRAWKAESAAGQSAAEVAAGDPQEVAESGR